MILSNAHLKGKYPTQLLITLKFYEVSNCHAPVTPETHGDACAILIMVCVHWTILGSPSMCLYHQETQCASQLLLSYALIIAPLFRKFLRNYKRLTIN